MSEWNAEEVKESLLGIEYILELEELIKLKRNTGPFGGASIESVSLRDIIRKGREQSSFYKSQISSILPAATTASEPYFARSIQVYFEDKYQRSNRFLVESYRASAMIIPQDLNGFEYLCHPNLEREEDFLAYFRSWQSTTLFSLCTLLQNSPIVQYFLYPLSEQEREVSMELRKRFNLVVLTDENPKDVQQDPKPSAGLISGSVYGPLQQILSTRQDLKRIILKTKIHVLKDFSQILSDLKSVDKRIKMGLATPLTNIGTEGQDSMALNKKANQTGRNRFLSEDLPEVGGLASRRRQNEEIVGSYKMPNDRSGAISGIGNRSVKALFSNIDQGILGNQLSINNNSEEASESFKSGSTHRPFKVQENILEERQQQMHRRRVSVGQNSLGEVSTRTNFYRKNTDFVAGATNTPLEGRNRFLDGPVTELEGDSEDDDLDDYQFGIGVNKVGAAGKQNLKTGGNRRPSIAQKGLANIATFLISEGAYNAELDEDDRVAEITNAIECAQMVAKGFRSKPDPKELAIEGDFFVPTQLVFNMPDNHGKDISEYMSLGDWLVSQRR